MHLANPWWLLLAIPAVLLVVMLKSQGYLRLPSLPTVKNRRFGMRSVPRTLLVLAFIFIGIALATPQAVKTLKLLGTVKGRDIICALDYSGSMAEKFKGNVPPVKLKDPFFDEEPSSGVGRGRRIDAGQNVILNFVEWRRQKQSADAVGLIVFDDRPLLRWPLDRDLLQISRHGNFVPPGQGREGLGGGTNFGTKPPGPIDLAAEHFEAKAHATRVLVLVTDGEDKLAPEVQERLVKVIKDARVRLYVVGIGDKIKDADILKVAEAAGGKSFPVNNADDLNKCFASIDELESSPMPLNFDMLHEELFYIPLTIGLLLAFLWALSESVLFGK
jgi:hypothetical protein